MREILLDRAEEGLLLPGCLLCCVFLLSLRCRTGFFLAGGEDVGLPATGDWRIAPIKEA